MPTETRILFSLRWMQYYGRSPRSAIFVLTRVSRSYSQGLTQKHPSSEHLKTNPGWQVTAKLPVEGADTALELLACCP